MATPRPLRPLLAAATAGLLSLAAVGAQGLTSAPGSGPGVAAAPSTSMSPSQADSAKTTERAARAAAEQAARARRAQDASRAAARKAAAQQAARKAAAQKAAKDRAAAAARAQAKARAAAAAKAKAARAAKAAKDRAARSATRAAAAPARTSWPALNRAIARIPGYRNGIARWHVTSRYGHYGITDANQPGAANIYISPNVPASKLYSVAAHEYGHAVVIANYGTGYGPYTEYSADMVRQFGGNRVTGLERAADCIALRLGATWTNYTGCGNASWRNAAGVLLRGGKL